MASTEHTPWIGVLAPARELDLAANQEGRLHFLNVAVGDAVEQGQILGQIEPRGLSEDINTAEAALNSALVESASAHSQTLRSAERLERLRRAGSAIARETVDEASTSYEQAKAAEQSAEARVIERRNTLTRLQKSQQRSAVRAPFSGIVSQRYSDDGALVNDDTLLLRVVASDGLVVRFALPSAMANELRIGQTLWVQFGHESGANQAARLSWIAPVVDLASQLVFAEAWLEQGEQTHSAGLEVWVSQTNSGNRGDPGQPDEP